MRIRLHADPSPRPDYKRYYIEHRAQLRERAANYYLRNREVVLAKARSKRVKAGANTAGPRRRTKAAGERAAPAPAATPAPVVSEADEDDMWRSAAARAAASVQEALRNGEGADAGAGRGGAGGAGAGEGPPGALGLAQALAALCTDDMQGQDAVIIDMREKCDWTERMVVVTGVSPQHVRAMGESVVAELRARGVRGEDGEAVTIEGRQNDDWILVDGGDVVVQLFEGRAREKVGLEKLWSDDAKERASQQALDEPEVEK